MIRNQHLDSAKGILIFLVVFGHLIEPFQSHDLMRGIYRFIYTFHMPAFIFISGMLANGAFSSAWAGKVVNTILVPLMAFTLLYESLHYVLEGAISDYTIRLAPYWILWFLLSLLFWRLATPLLLYIRWPLAFSVAIALIMLTSASTGYYLSLARTFSFLPFYTLGLIYGRTIVSYIQNHPRLTTIMVSVLILSATTLFSQSLGNDILYGSWSFPQMKLSMSEGVRLRMLTYALSTVAVLSFLIIALRTRALASWGRQSLLIYLWHGVLLRLLFKFADKSSMVANPITTIIAFILLSGFICLLLSSKAIHELTEIILRPLRFITLSRQPTS